MEERAVHPLKVDLGILVRVEGRVMVWRDWQSRNIDEPTIVVWLLIIIVSDNGSTILVFISV